MTNQGTRNGAERAGRTHDSTGLRGWVWPLLWLLPLGAAIALWLRALPRTVHSEAELAEVGFGWPFPWTVQDQSRYSPQSFPMNAEYVGPRGMAEPLITHIDWMLFAADTLILWAAASALLALVLRLLRPLLLKAASGRSV